MNDDTMRTVVQGLESMGVHAMSGGHWRVSCKLCKRQRQFAQAEMLKLRVLRVAFCTDCLTQLGVATVKPSLIQR